MVKSFSEVENAFYGYKYCKNTGLYVGYVPGFAGAHSQGKTLDELNRNLKEVLEILLKD